MLSSNNNIRQFNYTSESKLKGSTYFPTSISGIYNATMIIQQRHFPVCPSVSKQTYCEYQQLKGLTARSASTKEYCVSAAMKLVSELDEMNFRIYLTYRSCLTHFCSLSFFFRVWLTHLMVCFNHRTILKSSQ